MVKSLYELLSDKKVFLHIFLFSFFTAVILTPYRPYLLSKVVVGKPSPLTVVAPVDVEVVDEEATEKLRERVKENAPDVYRFDTGWVRDVYDKLSRSFFILRGLYARGELTPDRVGDILKKELGVDLSRQDLSLLIETGFSFSFESNLYKVLKEVSTAYIIDRPTDKPVALYDPVLKHYRLLTDTDRVFSLSSVGSLVERVAYRIFPLEDQRYISVVRHLIEKLVKPTLYYDAVLTEKFLEKRVVSISPVKIKIEKGEVVVSEGQIVTPEAYKKLKVLSEVVNMQSPIRVLFSLFFFILVSSVLFTLLWRFLYRDFRLTFHQSHKLALFLVFEALLLIRGFMWLYNRIFAPYAFTGKLFLGLSSPMFLVGLLSVFIFGYPQALFPISYVAVLSSFVPSSFSYMPFVIMVSSIGAGNGVKMGKGTNAFIKGIFYGVSSLLLLSFVVLLYEPAVSFNILFAPFMAGISVFFSSFASLPIFERFFGVVTDISLLELANLDHPLLRMLLEKAPGTYNHSMYVGILAETAAKEVGANPVLAKVGGYFHDIGKLKNPKYFIENTMGVSAHEKLSPSMSRLIIISHVKDGVELAKQYGLPRCVIDIIEQHHGTSLMSYFYHKAKKSEDEVDEALYRYPGPKPKTKEAAIVMLADSVEAAARSLTDPTPSKIKNMVSAIVNNIFTDGQLDECDLTFRDVKKVSEVFVKMLISLYHKRVKYPGQEEGDGSNGNKQNGKADKNRQG